VIIVIWHIINMLDPTIYILELVQCCIIAFILIFVLLCIVVRLTTKPYPDIVTYPQEKYYNGKEGEFPSIDSSPTVQLSVIIPAYNEEQRLPNMLEDCIHFLDGRKATYELIIVDDGSKDKTSEIGKKLAASQNFTSEKIRVLTLAANRGKGGAVRMGMLRARGKYLLFADADGATTFSELSKLEKELGKIESGAGHGLVCGSRAHLQDESISSRSFFRTILMYGFHACVWMFAVKHIRDTQCGFKLMTRPTARLIFRSIHIERWAFDVEMLKIAEMVGVPVSEVAVRWTEIDGSKLNPILAAIQMFRDIFLLWLRYAVGAWKLCEKSD